MAPAFTAKQWVLSHLVMLALLGLAALQYAAIVDKPLRFTALNIGQGDALLVETPEFKNVLIDAGPDYKLVQELGRALPFFERTVDLFIITNPDRDHYAGILDALDQYAVKAVMLTGISNQDPLFQDLLSKLRAKKIPLRFAENDRDLQIGASAFLDIVYPFHSVNLIGQKVQNRNNTSIMARLMRVKNGAQESLVMLTGDAELEEEKEVLLSGADLKSAVLKAGHHGSRTSSSVDFITAVQPEQAVISSGRGNSYGHPHRETLEHLKAIPVHNTQNEGAITLTWP